MTDSSGSARFKIEFGFLCSCPFEHGTTLHSLENCLTSSLISPRALRTVVRMPPTQGHQLTVNSL